MQRYVLSGLLQAFLFLWGFHYDAHSQGLSNFKVVASPREAGKSDVVNSFSFNGYTNHWNNYYTEWHRYGNLFKNAVPDIPSTILLSKIEIAEDLGIPGLLLQEGFYSLLSANSYLISENPSPEELEKLAEKGNVLVYTDPSAETGQMLESKAGGIFERFEKLNSYQYNDLSLEMIKAFYLFNGKSYVFVISSSSKEQMKRLQTLLENTKSLLGKYKLHKGWLGISNTYKAVTCSPGHPLEVIGKGMNEGVSWFIFDGYMSRYGKSELEDWVKEARLPIIADVGYSQIYGCSDYENLQVQDMATNQAWIDYAHKKGGYAFRQVYDPGSDPFEYDGYIANAGNKFQIDNENVPFISKAGGLSENLTSSMVLFIDKGKALSKGSIWEAIMGRKAVAVQDHAFMMGPSQFRNALQLLYLDRYFLEDYFLDNLDIETKVSGYDLIISLTNFSPVPVKGSLEIPSTPSVQVKADFQKSITLQGNETRQITIPVQPLIGAMGKSNPISIIFSWGEKSKSTTALLDLPPAISAHQLLYAHAPKVSFPVTVHNFKNEKSFPVEVVVVDKKHSGKEVLRQTSICETAAASHKEMTFDLPLVPGDYAVTIHALGATAESQLGVGRAEGKSYVYEMDLNSDGIKEYRMENDSVMITLLATGARVIEYIVKSRNDNILFKSWPEKTYNHKRPFRMRGYYPYGGFEDFLGQASMETHEVYDAKIIKSSGDFVQVEMSANYYGNSLKKIFTLFGNSPLLEVKFALDFKNPEANVLGPQPILELGKTHGTEDVFTVPALGGTLEYRMRPEDYYGAAIDLKEGWNAGYDTNEDVTFIGAFPVSQPIFLHMWMNHPKNGEAPHYYVEFQPWTPIVQKTTMYFSYYLWGSGGQWQNGLEELKKRNLISIRK